MNNRDYPSDLPERNPATYQQHRKEVFWQITLPMLIVVILILGMTGIAVSATAGQQSQWANISIIWLAIPSLFFGLVFFIILAGLIYLVTRLLGVLPPYARLAQDWLVGLRYKVGEVSDQAVEPILRVEQTRVSMHTLIQHMRRDQRR